MLNAKRAKADATEKKYIPVRKFKDDFLNVWTYGYKPWRYPRNWFYNIINFFRTIRFAFQRAKYGFCGVDVSDLDQYYFHLMEKTIKFYTANELFCPGCMSEKQWEAILRNISFSFKMAQESNEFKNPYEKEYFEYFDKRMEQAKASGTHSFPDPTPEEEALIKNFRETEQKNQERKERFAKYGLRLLAKYHPYLYW